MIVAMGGQASEKNKSEETLFGRLEAKLAELIELEEQAVDVLGGIYATAALLEDKTVGLYEVLKESSAFRAQVRSSPHVKRFARWLEVEGGRRREREQLVELA